MCHNLVTTVISAALRVKASGQFSIFRDLANKYSLVAEQN